MEIRSKLSLQFTAIVAVIQLILSVAIYFLFAQFRIEDLYSRLEDKATSMGQMLMEIEEIDTDLLKKIETNNPLSLPNEKTIIYDERDRLLFTNDDKGEMRIHSDLIDQVRLNNRIRSSFGEYEILGRLYTSASTRIVVFVGAIDLYGFRKLAVLKLILLIVFIAGLVIVYFAGRIFAGRAVQPILKVMSQVDQIGVTNLNARLDEGNSRDEIARLSATFNKLLERLETSFRVQKSFIANASHELNTPLTVITGQLEVVLMKARTNDEYAKSILDVLNEIRNLNVLSKKLLMLAQTSSEASNLNFSPLRIDDLLWQIRSDLVNRYPTFIIKIELDEELTDENQLIASGNEVLMKTAFANIIENGCKYSDNHQVVVRLSMIGQDLVIHFTDKGIGIPEQELPMIFQPFYRSRSAKNISGHGIGLSLVENIIILHKGYIRVSSQPGKGSDFEVGLPLARLKK